MSHSDENIQAVRNSPYYSQALAIKAMIAAFSEYENHRLQKQFEVFNKKNCRVHVHLICRQGFAGGAKHVRHSPAIKAAEEER